MPLVGHALWRAVVALTLLVAIGVAAFWLGLAYAFGEEHRLIAWLALTPFTALVTTWVVVRGRWSDQAAPVQMAFTAVAAVAGMVGALVARSALGLLRLRADAGVGAGDLRERLWLLTAVFAFAAALATALPSSLPRRVVLGGVGTLAGLAAAGAVAAAAVPALDCDAVDPFAFRTADGRPGPLDTHSQRELLADGFARCGTLRGLSRAGVRARLGGDGRSYSIGESLLGTTTLDIEYRKGRVGDVQFNAGDFD